MSIAAAVISGLVSIGSQIIGGVSQSEALDKSQKEARRLNNRQMAEGTEARKAEEKLAKSHLLQNQKQFESNLAFGKEELEFEKQKLGVSQELNARKSFRDQYSQLTQILDKNEGLKNLYINRLASLRS